jgi:AraC-like DNA-binding protein
VRLLDSPHRPPAFVMGARGSFWEVDGDCAPSYLEVLLAPLGAGPQPWPEVAWAWRRLVATGGAVPIGQVANEVGWSHRHLIARFRRQVGVRPKTAARLVRFGTVWRRLDQDRPLAWADVAREAGYADQAHLVRDFRQFTGMPPTRFLAAAASQPGPGMRGRGVTPSSLRGC